MEPADRDELVRTLESQAGLFGLELSADAIRSLADYAGLVREFNPRLHLVAPTSPEDFAVRHILESLFLLSYLPDEAKIVDLGAGAGLPSIPCLIVRDDVYGYLVESKDKKARFLSMALRKLGLEDRTEVINRQFREVEVPAGATHVVCRAIERFEAQLSRILEWSESRPALFFGGPNLEAALKKAGRDYLKEKLAGSDRRFLFVIE